MEIHNINEEIIKEIIEDYCGSDNFDHEKFCSCRQCRLDVACYVLNNTKPHYSVSSRGIVHHELDYSAKLQETADFYHLVQEGFSVITSRKRPGIDHSIDAEEKTKTGIFFNFPNIMGKVLDGKTFEPVSNTEIKLYLDEKLVPMTTRTAANPTHTENATNGFFIFQPAPVKSDNLGEESVFSFKIEVKHPDFQEYIRLIDIQSTSDNIYRNSIHMQDTLNIDDIYLFPVVE